MCPPSGAGIVALLVLDEFGIAESEEVVVDTLGLAVAVVEYFRGAVHGEFDVGFNRRDVLTPPLCFLARCECCGRK